MRSQFRKICRIRKTTTDRAATKLTLVDLSTDELEGTVGDHEDGENTQGSEISLATFPLQEPSSQTFKEPPSGIFFTAPSRTNAKIFQKKKHICGYGWINFNEVYIRAEDCRTIKTSIGLFF